MVVYSRFRGIKNIFLTFCAAFAVLLSLSPIQESFATTMVDSSSTSSIEGTYIGYIGGSRTPFITMENLSKSEALAKCKKDKKEHVGKSIRCRWQANKHDDIKNKDKHEDKHDDKHDDDKNEHGNMRPSITFTAPVGGIKVPQGGDLTFSWTSSNITRSGAIAFWLYSKGKSLGIIKRGAPVSGSYTWTIPQPNSRIICPDCGGIQVTPSPGEYKILATAYTSINAWLGDTHPPQKPILPIYIVSAESKPFKITAPTENNMKQEMVTCMFTGTLTNNSTCTTTIGTTAFSCTLSAGSASCSVGVYGQSGTVLTWKNNVGEIKNTIIDGNNEYITFGTPVVVTPVITPGVYIAYVGGSQIPFTTRTILKDDALANCKALQQQNTLAATRCTWEGQEIYSYTPPAHQAGVNMITCVFLGATSASSTCTGEINTVIYSCTGISSCSMTATGTSIGTKITWQSSNGQNQFIPFSGNDTTVVFPTIAAPAVDTYNLYFGGNATASYTKDAISHDDALSNCMLNHNSNPTITINCTWGTEILYSFTGASPVTSTTPPATIPPTTTITGTTTTATGDIEIVRTPGIITTNEVGTPYIITWKFFGNIYKTNYVCKVGNTIVAGTTGLNSVERIHGVYSEKMVGNNVCEWIGYDRSGKEIMRKSEKFTVKKRATTLGIITNLPITTVAPDSKEMVTCLFSGSTSTQSSCYTSVDGGSQYTCSGKYSCTIPVYGKKGTKLTWKSSLGGYGYTTIDNQDERVYFSPNRQFSL